MAQSNSGGGAAKTSVAGSVSSAGNKVDPNLNALLSLGGKMSTDVDERHLKVLFWGNTGSGKTEMILRNFPGIAFFDTEGNSDVCVDKKEIPPFLQIKTRDIRKIISGIQAARKPISLPGVGPIQTIGIDSGSVLWAEQSDVAAYLAEQRAQRKNQDIDGANTTQLDWGKAKRPLKRLMLEFSLTYVPFLVMTAREKDLYEGDGDNARKIGFTPDLVKNSLYDFNLAVRLYISEGKRCYEITKVQGSIGDIFPMSSKGVNFPVEKLLEYAKRLKPAPEETTDGDTDVASMIAEEEAQKSMAHTQANLITYATSKGFSAAQLGTILKGAGFNGFQPSRWDDMVRAVDEAVLAGETVAVG